MDLGRTLAVALRMTIVTTIVLGLGYPMLVTGLAQALLPDQANGQLIERRAEIVGSRLIGQPFSSPGYFWSRPSAAGHGYDAAASGGSNLGPTNRVLVQQVQARRARLQAENPGTWLPVELVTASASGLDPHLSPAGAAFQVARVARERGLPQATVAQLVAEHTEGRQLGFLGEPRVNILLLNLALDQRHSRARAGTPVQVSSYSAVKR